MPCLTCQIYRAYLGPENGIPISSIRTPATHEMRYSSLLRSVRTSFMGLRTRAFPHADPHFLRNNSPHTPQRFSSSTPTLARTSYPQNQLSLAIIALQGPNPSSTQQQLIPRSPSHQIPSTQNSTLPSAHEYQNYKSHHFSKPWGYSRGLDPRIMGAMSLFVSVFIVGFVCLFGWVPYEIGYAVGGGGGSG